MSEEEAPRRRVSSHLHPFVHLALIGFVLWFVFSVWTFSGAGESDYLLAIVSGFFFIAVAIPCILSFVWRRNKESDAAEGDRMSLREWASGEFETWQGRLKGSSAAVEALLPIAAAALGMTAFGIVLHFTSHGAV